MKYPLAIIFLVLTLSTFSCETVDSNNQNTATILIDSKYLESTRLRIEKEDPAIKYAFDKLIEDAEKALKEGPLSVTDKEKLPPSGDKHDYASYSRYWWPDPNQPNGLPYIRRDGETNPASQSLKESDRQRIGALGLHSETLGLAYYLTGEEKYAKKAAELIRAWFLDPATRMNPNLNHAQCRLGHNKGTKTGVLDGRLMIQAMEASMLIANSSALSDTERKGLKNWAKDYLNWLTTNEMALAEAAANNNHGSFYDVQALYFSLFSGDHKVAVEIAQKFSQRRVYTQIKPDGSMPEETARTRPLFYSIYNLHAMFLVAHLAEQVDVDIWKADDENARLRLALDYLVPYADPKKPWPYPTKGEADRMEMLSIFQMADRAYPSRGYMKIADKLPMEKRRIHRANLLSPLMR